MQNKHKNTTYLNLITKKQNNWKEYNSALKNRSDISIYISEAVVHGAFITLNRKKAHKATFNVDFCREFRGKRIVLLVDSSGFKIFGEGEWKFRKHGYSYRRTWRETHIAIDWETRNIVGLINTKSGVHDNTQLVPLLSKVREQHEVATVIGDGAYDAKANYLLREELGIEIIVPPPKNATERTGMNHYRIYDMCALPPSISLPALLCLSNMPCLDSIIDTACCKSN